ncbi:MAG: ABC transporter permease subunit [Vicinamibacterales bacterium]
MGSRMRIGAVIAKEFAELRATPSVLLGPLAMLATAVAVPLAVAVGIPAWTGETLAAADDLVALARSGGRADALGDEAAVQAYLLGQFLPLFVLVPVVGAMALVTTSIVDELRSRTLEPLLATPITTLELLVAKAAGAFAVAMALLAAGLVTFAAVVAATAGVAVVAALASWNGAVLLGGLAPAATAAALLLGVVVSSRVRDARTAQQFSVVVVLPLVALFVGQLGAGVGTAALLGASAVGWLVAAALALAGVRVFDRERILTRWTD